MIRHVPIVCIAAALTSAALILPTSGVAAQGWQITNRNSPMITGSGRVTQQARPVGAFRRIETVGSETVQVRFGPRPSLVIAADDNILPLITTEVRNGTLRIGSRGSFRMRGPIRVQITTPALDHYGSTGSGNVAIDGVNTDRLSLVLSGSGDIRATGRARELKLTINGSGRAALEKLVTQQASVALHGSGDASVRPTSSLDAQVFGSGTIRYWGSPQVRQQRFGSGQIVAVR